jgi:hypothetical protein
MKQVYQRLTQYRGAGESLGSITRLFFHFWWLMLHSISIGLMSHSPQSDNGIIINVGNKNKNENSHAKQFRTDELRQNAVQRNQSNLN